MPHLTAPQLRKALAQMDAQIEGLRAVLATYEATFTEDVPEPVYDAWNAAQDALSTLEFQREQVARNPRPITGAAADTWALVCANVD